MKLKGKKIALCVTGSVAAIQSPLLARELMRNGAEVTAYMSRGAMDIIHKNTMEFATGREVVTEITGKLEHLYTFDLVIIAPATANTIGKISGGISDTPASALVSASTCRALIAPAMDMRMYENCIFRKNIKKLKGLGFIFIEPKFEEGKAKLADIPDIVDAAIFELSEKDYAGKNIVVTAGPTLEYIDPIRIITNKSSGKMGIAIAREAYFRGAKVKLIYGAGTVKMPGYLDTENVETSKDMLKAVKTAIADCDVYISAAAVSDFTLSPKAKKIETKRGPLTLKLIPAQKILENIRKSKAVKVGFKALYGVSKKELCDAGANSLKKYGLDMVVANDVKSGPFGSDENDVYIIGKKAKPIHMKNTKGEIAKAILDLVKKGE